MTTPPKPRAQSGDNRSVEFIVKAKEIQGNGAVAVMSLTPADGAIVPPWEPGAHVDMLLFDGVERQYSICSLPSDLGQLRFGVLLEPEGRGGSRHVHESLAVGDRIHLRPPRNNYPLAQANDYLFIAGGIGVTPFLPMIATVDQAGKSWRLVYGGRSADSMAFVEELKGYGERVTLWPQDSNGHIEINSLVSGIARDTVVYCCGPEPLLRAVEAAMEGHPEDQLRTERFHPAQELVTAGDTAFDVILDYSEVRIKVRADQSIAQALDEAGIEVSTSCREGTCGTCETVVLAGTPEHRDSYLTASEKTSGETMMVCCSRALSPTLTLDL